VSRLVLSCFLESWPLDWAKADMEASKIQAGVKLPKSSSCFPLEVSIELGRPAGLHLEAEIRMNWRSESYVRQPLPHRSAKSAGLRVNLSAALMSSFPGFVYSRSATGNRHLAGTSISPESPNHGYSELSGLRLPSLICGCRRSISRHSSRIKFRLGGFSSPTLRQCSTTIDGSTFAITLCFCSKSSGGSAMLQR